jgi:hypothetical protein
MKKWKKIVSKTRIFNIDIYQMKDLYFHGTDEDGLIKILESGNMGIKYFDFEGIFITNDYDEAWNHGKYVFALQNLNSENFLIEESNQGIFHKGLIDLDKVKFLVINQNDGRFSRDLINSIIEKYKNEEIRPD